RLEIDHQCLRVSHGEVFLRATDGVYEHGDAAFMAGSVHAGRADLDRAARTIVEEAFRRGSLDNLTVQIVVVDEIPARAANEISLQLAELAPAPLLEARMMLDGYRIVRELHGSHRSHVYLAEDTETGQLVAIKTP